MDRWYLIHKHSNWNSEFQSEAALVEYLKANGFNRRRLYDYLILHGEGAWERIAGQLPAGPKPNAAEGSPIEECPF